MLSLTELQLIERLELQLRRVIPRNEMKYKYVYGHLQVKDLGVTTPPRLKGINSVLGWGSSAVDVLAERIQFRGFYSPNDNVDELNVQFRENELESEQRAVTKDSLATGVSFITAGIGDQDLGEPEIIYTPESPNFVTGDYHHKGKKFLNALKLVNKENHTEAVLYLPYATITLIREKGRNKSWFEVDRDEHNLGFVPVTPVRNNWDSKYVWGRSEISRPLRGHIESGMRVILGTELASAFFAVPFRVLSGSNPGDFSNEDGTLKNVWDLVAGNVAQLPYNSVQDVMPTLTQLPASNPENIMNLIESFGRLAAREIGVPPSYFGFETSNPSSADAIIESDKKLITKTKTRIPEFKRAWKEAFRQGQLLAGKPLPEDWDQVQATFMRPETPTPAAAADRISKLNAAGVFEKPLPDFVYRELNFDETEIMQLKKFISDQQGNSLIQGLLNQNGAAATTEGA